MLEIVEIMDTTNSEFQETSLFTSCFLPYRNPQGLQMRRYQGLEVEDYVFTLDALPLKPSRFCNDGGNIV